jgi:hypothetical protein
MRYDARDGGGSLRFTPSDHGLICPAERQDQSEVKLHPEFSIHVPVLLLVSNQSFLVLERVTIRLLKSKH